MKINLIEHIDYLERGISESLVSLKIDKNIFEQLRPLNLVYRNLYRFETKPRVCEQTQNIIKEYIDGIFEYRSMNVFILGLAQELELLSALYFFKDEQMTQGATVNCYCSKPCHTYWLIQVIQADKEERYYFIDVERMNIMEMLKHYHTTGNIGRRRFLGHLKELA